MQFKFDVAIFFSRPCPRSYLGSLANMPNDNIFLVAKRASPARTAVLALMLLIGLQSARLPAVLVCVLTVKTGSYSCALNPDTRHVYADTKVSYRDAMKAAHEADDFILANVEAPFWYNRK